MPLYTNGVKIWRETTGDVDSCALQVDLDISAIWSTKWQMPIKATNPTLTLEIYINKHSIIGESMPAVLFRKKLEVIVRNDLRTAVHCLEVTTIGL